MTPYLRIGSRGHVGIQHVGTRWDTMGKMGKMGHDRIQWDTRHIILGTGRNKLGYSTEILDTTNLGHAIWDTKFGTQNLGHKMGDKGGKWDTT